jgi:hypothetical protein
VRTDLRGHRGLRGPAASPPRAGTQAVSVCIALRGIAISPRRRHQPRAADSLRGSGDWARHVPASRPAGVRFPAFGHAGRRFCVQRGRAVCERQVRRRSPMRILHYGRRCRAAMHSRPVRRRGYVRHPSSLRAVRCGCTGRDRGTMQQLRPKLQAGPALRRPNFALRRREGRRTTV